MEGVDSCLSGALVDELDDAVRKDLVLGDGGGDHCDFASANVGARCDKGAGTLACREATGFRLSVGTAGVE